MKTILLLGAGRSATVLIDYLSALCQERGWTLRVADVDKQLVESKTHCRNHVEGHVLDLHDKKHTYSLVGQSDVVISLLPPGMHVEVAEFCLNLSKHLLTASYMNPDMAAYDGPARSKDLLFLSECGLDPGLDHMSAMQVFDRLRAQGAILTGFYSFCGGLVAPESDTNPWGYKVSWNPRNVVLAGQGMAQYLEDGQIRYIPYRQLFRRLYPVHFPDLGAYEAYANRDSLSYKSAYGLTQAKTLLRGTIRKQGYAAAWDVLASLGMTDDTTPWQGQGSWADFTRSFLPAAHNMPLRQQMADYLALPLNDTRLDKIEWLGLFDEHQPLPDTSGTPAHFLQKLIESRWALQPADHDLVLMQHWFDYTTAQGHAQRLVSSLKVVGQDAQRTAMATTVGLPLGIVAKLLLDGRITQRGVALPLAAEIYEPVLTELAQHHGLSFHEEEAQR